MHPRTLATLDKLRSAEWFVSVGIRNVENVEVVSSWYEALESCSSPEWEELCLEAANQYCERINEKAPERFSQWNDIVSRIRPESRAIVRDKTKTVVLENNLPIEFLSTVDWDILHLCMEAEFADVCPPGFYASQAYWYVNGRFPCGWNGKFPQGHLVIY